MPRTAPLLIAVSVLATVAACARVGAATPRLAGGFPIKTPAYIATSSSGALLLSQFGPFEGGTVTVVDGFASRWPNINGSMPNRTIGGFVWPNVFTEAPKGMMDATGAGFFVGDGFLVPGKGDGHVMYFDTASTKAAVPVTTVKSNYFYHVAIPFDVDGDGDMDLVTARAKVPLFERGSGELLWLENPTASGAPASPVSFPWVEHVIGNGPDFIIAVAPISTPDRLVVVASEYFNARVTVSTLSRGRLVSYKSVVSGLGNLEDVTFAQLRGDGSWQVIITNHVPTQAQSGVFILDPPADLSLPWPLTIAAQGMFKTLAKFQGASPGFAFGFYPTSRQVGPASIALAGDGTFEAYILTPGPVPLSNYTVQRFVGPYGTIGTLLVRDLNGDGYTDIVVPCFDKNEVLGYTFQG